jgi:hypothetical protein
MNSWFTWLKHRWDWPLTLLFIYLVFALLYRSTGLGLRVPYREHRVSFYEMLPNGEERRIDINVHFPEYIFTSLPWFDSPQPQMITFSVANIKNVQGLHKIVISSDKPWLIQVIEENKNIALLEWLLNTDEKSLNSLIIHIKHNNTIINQNWLYLNIDIDPKFRYKSGELLQIAFECEFCATVRRFFLLFFGEFTILLSAIGLFYQYYLYRQDQVKQQIKAKLQEIIDLIKSDLISAIINLMQIDVNRLDKLLQTTYNDIKERISNLSWEIELLRRIDSILLKDERMKMNELLNLLANFYNQIHNKESQNENVDWRKVAEIYSNDSFLVLDNVWPIVESIWERFDIDARELVVDILIHLVEKKPEEKASIRDKLMNNSLRRLGHHPRIKEWFGDITSPPSYPWLHRPVSAPSLADTIEQWLNGRENPFYPGRAEMESVDRIKGAYYLPAWLRPLVDEPGSYWLYGGEGSGRTALSLYLAYQAGEHRWFPVRLSWSATHPSAGQTVVADLQMAIMQALAAHWLDILPSHPTAVLDLPSAHQQQVITMLRWAVGDDATLIFGLRKATPEEALEKPIQVLESRIQVFKSEGFPYRSAPVPSEWFRLRPAGLEATCVIIEVEDNLPPAACRHLLAFAGELAAEQVYLRFIALHEPPFPAVPLRWSSADLEAILDQRQADRLFFPRAVAAIRRKLAITANGRPRAMMALGQQAIKIHVERAPEDPYLHEDDIAAAIHL